MRVIIERVGGVETRYFHEGSGRRALLMLHGVGVSSDSWFWNVRDLGRELQCIAPDMLGFGLTDEGSYSGGPPQELIVDHLVALCDQLDLQEIVVVGSSFGANIAAHLYWRIPSRVKGLVLVGCGPALNGVETLSLMYEQSFENGIAAMRNPTLDVCSRRMKNLVFDISTVPEALLAAQLTLYALPGAADRYERRMRGIKQREALALFDVTSRVHTITVPTKIVWGRHDIRGDLNEATAVADRILNGQMDIFEECGHLPYLEKPGQFNSILRQFVAELR